MAIPPIPYPAWEQPAKAIPRRGRLATPPSCFGHSTHTPAGPLCLESRLGRAEPQEYRASSSRAADSTSAAKEVPRSPLPQRAHSLPGRGARLRRRRLPADGNYSDLFFYRSSSLRADGAVHHAHGILGAAHGAVGRKCPNGVEPGESIQPIGASVRDGQRERHDGHVRCVRWSVHLGMSETNGKPVAYLAPRVFRALWSRAAAPYIVETRAANGAMRESSGPGGPAIGLLRGRPRTAVLPVPTGFGSSSDWYEPISASILISTNEGVVHFIRSLVLRISWSRNGPRSPWSTIDAA